MTKALITGVTGCVGSNLAKNLIEQGVDVVGLCQPGVSTRARDGLKITRLSGDILDIVAVKRAMDTVDWVFHTAAIADDWRHPASRIYQVNVSGTQTILEAARQAEIKKLVFTSSSATLGIPTRIHPCMDEESSYNLAPEDWPYAWSKVLCERLMKRAEADGLNVVTVLPTAILGPADMNFISGQLIIRAGKGLAFPFPHGGVNYIDVRDVAEAQFQAAIRGERGERYLLGGHNLSHLHCLGTIADVLHARVRYIQIPNFWMPPAARMMDSCRKIGIRTPIDPQRVRMSGLYMYYNNQKAVEKLGLNPRPFDETVEDTYRWYADQGMMPSIKKPVFRLDSLPYNV
jgi:dihydroflavonol-4-reductase